MFQYAWYLTQATLSSACSQLTHYILDKADVFGQIEWIYLLFLHEKKCSVYSLAVLQLGASNEYPQHTFSWRNTEKCISIP